MKFGIVTFPASNCDYDAFHAVTDVLGEEATYLWHKDHDLQGSDVIVLPGGFSYGDYLRVGAIADYLVANDLPIMISTHVAESAVLEQAGLALARRIGRLWNFELGYSAALLGELAVHPAPGQPGLGVTLDEVVAERWTVRQGVAESSLSLMMDPEDLDE